MNGQGQESDDDGEVFLDDDDVIQEITVDDEDLPDQDDDDDEDQVADFTVVATGGKDEKGFLWQLGSVWSRFELTGHTETVSAAAFNFNGLLMATGDLAGFIRVWNTYSGICRWVLEGPGSGVEWLTWHPRRNLILAGGTVDYNVWMWNVDQGLFPSTFCGHKKSVTCGDFTPDGTTICTGSEDASLRIWNPENGQCFHAVTGYHKEGLTCLAITSNSKVAITCSKDSSICMVNISTGKVIRSLDAHIGSVEYIALSSYYPWGATGSLDGNLIIWDLQRSEARYTCNHKDGVICLVWLGASPLIATGCQDGKVRVWDSSSGSLVRTFNGHTDSIQSLAVSGNALVSVSLDSTARVFDISAL